MSSTTHKVSFPGETAEYRTARNELLEAEMALRRQTEHVAALRRKLPLGGLIKEDYTFIGWEDGSPTKVPMSSLFRPGKDDLIIYNAMYGPDMTSPCTSCTSIVDGLNGMSPHVNDVVNLVVVMRNPMDKVMELANSRNWSNLTLLSSVINTFNRDYLAETEKGEQMPMANVFTRTPDGIHHTWSSELLYAPKEPGQDGRPVDIFWPLWNLLDLTPGGRREKWYPALKYSK